MKNFEERVNPPTVDNHHNFTIRDPKSTHRYICILIVYKYYTIYLHYVLDKHILHTVFVSICSVGISLPNFLS